MAADRQEKRTLRVVGCVDATNLSEYAHLALPDGSSALERSLAAMRRITANVRLLVGPQTATTTALPDHERVTVASDGRCGLLETLRHVGQGYDVLVYAAADMPFLDSDIGLRMLRNHGRYVAEFSFADGYPQGMAPEMVTPQIIPALVEICRKEDAASGAQATTAAAADGRFRLFDVVQRDINAFDVETELAPIDLRALRLCLACDLRRNYLICKRLVGLGIDGETDLIATLQQRGDLLRSLPAFFSIEVVTDQSQSLLYSPYKRLCEQRGEVRREMPVADVGHIVDAIEEFAPHSMLHVSLWGEIALHSRVIELLGRLAAASSLRLLVETSGVGWSAPEAEAIMSHDFDPVTWIVDLDAHDPELYRRLRGDGYTEAYRFAERLLRHDPTRLYVQTTRMSETEADLERFYRYWSERTPNIVIQKYDHFCGVLPDRRVTDISPVDRRPCWHIARDMVVLVDGQVPLCREDLALRHPLGNLLTEDIETVWAAGERYYHLHLERDYSDICRSCDEYYTYNN